MHGVEHLLPGGGGGEQLGQPQGDGVTLEGLKFKEPMHMAQVAQGRNVVDDKGRLVAEGTSATCGGTGSGGAEHVPVFPETLQQAIEGTVWFPPSIFDLTPIHSLLSSFPGISEEPEAAAAAQREGDDVAEQAGGDPQEGSEPEPFGVTSGARSKL